MAAGDLITRDGQYEYNGLLFNDSKSDNEALKVLSCEGLFDFPVIKGLESELGDDHGGAMGRQLFSMRRIVMDIVLLTSSRANTYTKSENIASLLQPDPTPLPLVFQRAGVGKRFVNAKVKRFSGFRNDWLREFGQSGAAVEFVAPDPRKLAMVQSSQQIVIASGGTTNQGTVNMGGNFKGGARPILEIAGPVTNPRITNAGDESRAVRIDVVVGTGQTLILDSRDRTAKLGGVDQPLRSDNQWWVLNPGNNLVTFTRSNAPANTGTLTIKWWNSYV